MGLPIDRTRFAAPLQPTQGASGASDARRSAPFELDAVADPVATDAAYRASDAIAASAPFSPAPDAPTLDALLGALASVAPQDRSAFVAAVARRWATLAHGHQLVRLSRYANATPEESATIAVGLARAAIEARVPGRAALLAVGAVQAIAPGADREVFARLGADEAVAWTRALGLDARSYYAVNRSLRADVADVPSEWRVRAAERLVEASARAGEAAVVATAFGTFAPWAVRGALGRRLAEAIAPTEAARAVAVDGGRHAVRASVADEARASEGHAGGRGRAEAAAASEADEARSSEVPAGGRDRVVGTSAASQADEARSSGPAGRRGRVVGTSAASEADEARSSEVPVGGRGRVVGTSAASPDDAVRASEGAARGGARELRASAGAAGSPADAARASVADGEPALASGVVSSADEALARAEATRAGDVSAAGRHAAASASNAAVTPADEAARLEAIITSAHGRRLLFAPGVPEHARLAVLRVVRRDPSWTAARIPADPWTDPALMQAAFADRAADFALLRGDAPVALVGSDLENTVGAALGISPRSPTDADAAERAAADGRHDYFAEEPSRSVVAPIAAAIRGVGGDAPRVTVVPIQVSSAELGLVATSVFRVEDVATGASRFVDAGGRTYSSFEDWSTANELPSGLMSYPAGGRVGGELESRATPRTVDTVGEAVVVGLDVAATAGGLVAGVGSLFGTGGATAPVVAAASGAWVAGRSAEALVDRHAHGQSIDPFGDAAARAAWLEVAAGAVGLGAVVSAASVARFAAAGARGYAVARATASITNAAAIGFDAAAAFDAGHALLTRWDRLSGAERAALVVSLGFWGAQTGVQLGARVRRPFDVSAHRDALASAGERPSVETARELRSRGYRDTMGMSGAADAASPHAHLRAIARGQALADSLGARALARIRGIFEPSAALRRERDSIAAEAAELWRAHGAELSRATAKDASARTPAEQAVHERFEAVSARQRSVEKRIAADLRVRRVSSRKEGAEVMRGFMDALEASGVSRGEAERLAGEVRIGAETVRALEAGGVEEATLRAWLADFFQLTTKTRPAGELWVVVEAERARYVDGERKVDLGRDFVDVPEVEQRRRLFHELGHSIETQNPAVGKASVEWVARRAAGAGSLEPVALRTLADGVAYGAEELALEDHFVNPYVGKVYGNRHTTEVVSVGLEMCFDPEGMLNLYREDPEHFLLVLGMIR